MVSGPRLEAPAGLLARWGIPADAELARAERGCNNQTFAVAHGGRRWVLRISQNLSAEQARAEHRLLGRLRAAGLPFGVPEPVAALGGDTVAETPAGPATLCRWIPGVRPELAADPALERFGRAIGLLSRALRPVAWSDAPQDWRGDPLRAHPDAPGPASWPGRCAPRACPRPRSGDWRRPPSRSAPRRKRQRLTCRSRSCTATWAPRTRSWTSAPARCPGCSTSSWPGRTRGCRTCRSRCCSPARWPGPAGPAAPPPWSAGTPRS